VEPVWVYGRHPGRNDRNARYCREDVIAALAL
jgi:hypothetical protein